MLLPMGTQRPPLSSPPQLGTVPAGGGAVPSPLPGAQVPSARAERDGAGGARETPSCPFFQFVLLGLSFYIFLVFTCLCFLSSMLWQWCSMLMRQCVVQPQAVIFQVISRVLNTRLLLFHLPSSRSGFPLCREGPLAVPGHPELLLCRVPPSGLCEEVGGSAAVGAARWSGLAPPGCWEQRRRSVHGRCGCWWLRGGMWAESCQGNREAAGKSLKIPLFLPLGKLAGPLQKRCSSCRQQAAGTKSREGARISISHTSHLLDPCSSATQPWTLPPRCARQPKLVQSLWSAEVGSAVWGRPAAAGETGQCCRRQDRAAAHHSISR